MKTPQISPRERLLLAAESMFAEQGFHNAQVSDIARAAAVGTSTFYREFADKEALLRVLVEDFTQQLRAELRALRGSLVVQSPLEHFVVLHQSFQLFFTSMQRRPAMTRIVFGLGYGGASQVERAAQQFMQDFCDDLVTDMERIEATDMATMPDKQSLAQAIAGMALQVAYAVVVEGKGDLESAVRTCALFAAGGLSMYSTPDRWPQVLSALHVLAQSRPEAVPQAV